MNKESKKVLGLFSRYFAVLLLGVGNLYLFYRLFTPLTIWVFYTIVSIFARAEFVGNIIYLNGVVIEIVPACVAGAAYYLLFVLIMTSAMDMKTRFKAIGTALGAFFVANMFRLLVLAFIIGSPSFEVVHWVFWHLISSVFVVGIWFAVVKIYNIKSIPVYSDFCYLKKLKKKEKSISLIVKYRDLGKVKI